MTELHIGPPGPQGEPEDGIWPYLGIGCMTGVSGMMAFAMISVLIAKFVGYARGCAADAETGAPCDWYTFAVRGGLIGLVLVPTCVIWRMRRARASRTSK